MPETKTTICDDAAATQKRLEAKDPGLKQQLKKAYGYAVFPSVGKAALVVGGSYGRGAVFEKGKFIGHATISQLTLGVQIGGDTFSEIVIFESKPALDRFKQGTMAFAASASAVLVKAGATGAADFPKGVKALAYSRGGMLLEAAIGAQKFKFKPAGEEEEQEDAQEDSGGKRKGKSESSGRKQQGKAAASGDQGEEEESESEGDGEESSSGLLARAGGMLRRHPIAATIAGVGLAGVAMLVIRKLRSAGAESNEGSEDQDDSQEQDDQDDDAQGSADRDDDEDNENREEESDDEGGDDEQEGGRQGDMLGFLRRRRSRA